MYVYTFLYNMKKISGKLRPQKVPPDEDFLEKYIPRSF